MRRGARWAVGVTTLFLPVAIVAGFGVQSASAQGRGAPVAATGTVSCTGAAGHVKFSPPLTSTATDSSDTATIRINLSGCTGSGGNVTSAGFTGHASGTVDLASDNCSTLTSTSAVTGSSLTVRWTGKAGTSRLDSSALTLTSITGLPAGSLNGNPGFSFSGQAVSDSFSSATASGEFDSSSSAISLGAKCAGHGLKVLPINAGAVSQP